MTKQEREQYRQYVKNWQRVGPLLERIRIRELRSADYGKDWRIIDGFLEFAMFGRRTRLTSGLIEQQRIFARAKR